MGLFTWLLASIRRIGSSRRIAESEAQGLWTDSINELERTRIKLRELTHHLEKLHEVTEDIRMCDTNLRNKIIKL